MKRTILALSMLLLSACVTEQGPSTMDLGLAPTSGSSWLFDKTEKLDQRYASRVLERAALKTRLAQEPQVVQQGDQ